MSTVTTYPHTQLVAWLRAQADAHRAQHRTDHARGITSIIKKLERHAATRAKPTALPGFEAFAADCTYLVGETDHGYELDPSVYKAARGHTTLANTAVAAAMALALAWLGPTVLDGAPDGPGAYSAYGYTPADLEPGLAELLDAQARAACARGAHGAEGGYVALADGAVMCTDKRGRHARRAAMKGGA